MQNEKEILVMKLVNGEEILAEVIDEGNVYYCKNAISMFMQPREDGTMGMATMDYLPYCTDGFVITKIAVVAFGVPNKDMIDNYNRRFSKIQVPSQKIIV